MDKIQEITKKLVRKNVPELRSGQVIRVHERIKEGDKERVQVFEGLVIAVKNGKGLNGTFTVRKIGAGGVGVERIFPLHMPAIEKIEILRQEKVRRTKLYYVRGQVGKKTKKRKTKLENLIFDMGGTGEKLEEPGNAEDLSSEASANEEAAGNEAPTEEAAESQDKESKEEAKEDKAEDKKEGVEEEAAGSEDQVKTEDAPEAEQKEDSAPETEEEAPEDENKQESAPETPEAKKEGEEK